MSVDDANRSADQAVEPPRIAALFDRSAIGIEISDDCGRESSLLGV